MDQSDTQPLRDAPGFSDLTEQTWQQMKPHWQYRQFEAGEHLVRAGTRATYAFWLQSGVCREYFVTLDGHEFNKAFVVSGQFGGSLYDLINQGPSTVSIEFLKPSSGWLVHFGQLQALREQHPDLDHLCYRFTEQLFLKKSRREFELLTLDAAERYQRFLEYYPDLENSVPLYHIASYLGITPEALSRIRKKRA